ncbi:MAG: FMN-binding protein [Bdellovibrionales bacterium]|nr:FMN-binding protein [Bdellovibrionales bacterium]
MVLPLLALPLVLFAGALPAGAEDVYQEPSAFIDEVFEGSPPAPQVLPIIGERREAVGRILDHAPAMLRVRYWLAEERSAWVLEEIGKTMPITAGVVVADGRIEDVRVLIYRESHGAEVRHDFFTRQFTGATIEEGNELSRSIDGISGATLSVNAMRKLARVALYLDHEIRIR